MATALRMLAMVRMAILKMLSGVCSSHARLMPEAAQQPYSGSACLPLSGPEKLQLLSSLIMKSQASMRERFCRN